MLPKTYEVMYTCTWMTIILARDKAEAEYIFKEVRFPRMVDNPLESKLKIKEVPRA